MFCFIETHQNSTSLFDNKNLCLFTWDNMWTVEYVLDTNDKSTQVNSQLQSLYYYL